MTGAGVAGAGVTEGGVPALRFDGLEVGYRVRGRTASVLRGLRLTVGVGEAYGLVGESGCGKSTAALAALGALPPEARVGGGRVLAAGVDPAALSPAALRRWRAQDVAMVYQDPARALNPALSIGRQMAEPYALLGLDAAEGRARAAAMLARLRIPDPARVMAGFAHQLSGGQQQRVVIAMALAKDPRLLVLDEPTTGLDATVAAGLLAQLGELRRGLAAGMLCISHDLSLLGRLCDRVGVLYGGLLVEEGPAAALLAAPRHPYTAGLLGCLPRAGRHKGQGPLAAIPGLPPQGDAGPGCLFAPRCPMVRELCRVQAPPVVPVAAGRVSQCHFHAEVAALASGRGQPSGVVRHDAAVPALLDAVGVSRSYGAGRVLHDVSLRIGAGETLGLVGESGSGKSTLARVLLGLAAPDPGGRVLLDGKALAPLARHRGRAERRALQAVFQSPDGALNRAWSVAALLGGAVRRLSGAGRAARHGRVAALLEDVRLPSSVLPARPRQLSGGQKQRVAIAQALAGSPRLVVCDEPTASLDVSVAAAVLNLLAGLQARRGVATLFISHDLGAVRFLSDRIAVLYRGRLLELGPAEAVMQGPHHPYTAMLVAAAAGHPDAGAPAAAVPSGGCVFHLACPRRLGAICEHTDPPWDGAAVHAIRCHIPRAQL